MFTFAWWKVNFNFLCPSYVYVSHIYDVILRWTDRKMHEFKFWSDLFAKYITYRYLLVLFIVIAWIHFQSKKEDQSKTKWKKIIKYKSAEYSEDFYLNAISISNKDSNQAHLWLKETQLGTHIWHMIYSA